MPLFHFHVREAGQLHHDPEGIELADADAARSEAVKGARSLLGAAVSTGQLPLDDAIVVADAGGTVLFELAFRDAVES